MIGHGYHWHETTTQQELSEGRRTFVRGRKVTEPPVQEGDVSALIAALERLSKALEGES